MPSSGIHFGIISCQACKGFFGRSIKKQKKYECSNDFKCDVAAEKRNSCQYCRFQKCLQAGMSPDSKKITNI
jgi:hypothetical protein